MTLLHDIGTLERHRLFDSHDVDETQAQVSRYLCPHRFDVLGRSGLHTRLNGVFFGGAALLDLQYHAPVRVAVRDVADHYLVRLTLAGRCEVTHGTRRAQLQPGSLSVSSPFASSSITTDGECRNVILRVPRTALATQLQLLAGRSLNQPLLFDVGVDPGHPGVASVVHTLGYLCRLQSPGLQGQALDQGLSDFVVQLLLTQLPHNHSAERMAAWLNRMLPSSTRVLTSPARRTQQTVAALERKFKTLDLLAPDGSVEALLHAASWPDAREPVLVVGHQPTLGLAASYLMTAEPESWALRKGGVIWLRGREREGQLQVVLHAVIGPDLL